MCILESTKALIANIIIVLSASVAFMDWVNFFPKHHSNTSYGLKVDLTVYESMVTNLMAILQKLSMLRLKLPRRPNCSALKIKVQRKRINLILQNCHYFRDQQLQNPQMQVFSRKESGGKFGSRRCRQRVWMVVRFVISTFDGPHMQVFREIFFLTLRPLGEAAGMRNYWSFHVAN